jgi:hypothetical protein
MAHARRIRRDVPLIPALAHSRQFDAQLADRRLGGTVVLDYLFDLFAASPFEAFSRVSVLSVLDQVKKDRELFPDGLSDGRLQ